MPSSRFSYLWIQDGIPARRFLDEGVTPLEERLRLLSENEELRVEQLVVDTAHAIFGWALEHDATWTLASAGTELEAGIAALESKHGWRGPLAVLLDSLRLAWRRCGETGPRALVPRAALSEEAGLWVWSQREDLENWPDLAAEWSGEPLVPGRRMPSRSELARAAALELEPDETILVHGWSEALARSLIEAVRLGKRPSVISGEGLPLLEGRRLARRLQGESVHVTLVYDAVLPEVVPEADRVWIATEAIGACGSLAQNGARLIAREAQERGVPIEVLATSDALLPGGELRLPEWTARDRSLLWVEAPHEVELRTQFLEELAFDLAPVFVTEKGRERAEELCLRALRVERATPCTGVTATAAPHAHGRETAKSASPGAQTESAARDTRDTRDARETQVAHEAREAHGTHAGRGEHDARGGDSTHGVLHPARRTPAKNIHAASTHEEEGAHKTD